eukprot:g1155.t1
MTEANLPTSEYIRLKRDTEWLLDADHGRSSIGPYTQQVRSPKHIGPPVHKQPWRFNPTKSKTFDQIQNSKSVERETAERLLLNEIQQRHQDALDVYNDAQSFFRAKDQNEVVVSAMAKQLKKYKVECRRLRKQKRATLYVLRLLEQKILELSGSNATAEKIDPTAPGYEMHPEVYKILKEGHTAMKGCRGVQTGSDEVDIVEDYALERSAHELGLKLVRENRTKELDAQEKLEDEERAERLETMKESRKNDAPNSGEEPQAELPAANDSVAQSADLLEGNGNKEHSIQEQENDTVSQSNVEMATSLADKARDEILKERCEKFRSIFERLDTDMSGYLDKRELRKAVYTGDKELGSYIRPRTFAAAFAAMDYNDNGQIPYPAFEAFCLDCEDSTNTTEPIPHAVQASSPGELSLSTQRAQWSDDRLREIFDRLDSNKNGSLERIEILRASHSDPDLSAFITPKRVNASFAEMSRKGEDGKLLPIVFDDFKKFCHKASSRNLVAIEPSAEEMSKFRKIFERLDTNGNGTLERMELYKASHMDPEMSAFVAPRQFNQAFKRMDIHSSGHITFEAFADFCMDVENSKC